LRVRGSVIRRTPGEFEPVDLELDEPREGDVLVRMAASGLCHSDDHIAKGDMPVAIYPLCGGHEGSGVVVQVGPGVTHVAEGDHVVFAFMPACGRCRWCARGMQNLCDMGSQVLAGSRYKDPSSFRLSLDGAPVGQMVGLSTFAEYTCVDAASAVPIPKDIPLDKAALVGCGVGTGWGAAVNSAEVRVGDTVIVMGIGGIGINAVQGASHAGALHVIAVDPVPFKREMALKLGATHACPSIEEAADLARTFTNGQGADSAIVTVGVITGSHVAQAFAGIRKGGTVVVTGLGKVREKGIPIPIAELTLYQKRIVGSLYGACSPTVDIPLQLELYTSGMLKLDELITRRYSIDEVAQGYRDMHAGLNIRGLITFG
jgi:S-(hydroxymethyl)glutathione dehydrogenase/alcohol dehydrogenase